MYYDISGRYMLLAAAALIVAAEPNLVKGAPDWTAPNSPTADMVALYHFDAASSISMPATVRAGVPENTLVNYQLSHAALPQGQALEHYNFNDPAAGTLQLSADTASDALGLTALSLDGQVRFRASQIFPDANAKHLTVEAWIKWNDSATSSDLRLGTGDRALRIIRDAANPANNAIGFQGSHGIWRPHPGFGGWSNLPDPVTDNTWFHVAMVISNAGMHEHSGHWHYEDGTFAMIFVNGSLVGSGQSDRIPLGESDEELVFHGSDRLALWQTAGTSPVLVDEFTVWQRDFTRSGAVTVGLFADGRGGTAAVNAWALYE